MIHWCLDWNFYKNTKDTSTEKFLAIHFLPETLSIIVLVLNKYSTADSKIYVDEVTFKNAKIICNKKEEQREVYENTLNVCILASDPHFPKKDCIGYKFIWFIGSKIIQKRITAL